MYFISFLYNKRKTQNPIRNYNEWDFNFYVYHTLLYYFFISFVFISLDSKIYSFIFSGCIAMLIPLATIELIFSIKSSISFGVTIKL